MLLPFANIPGIKKPKVTQSATIYVTTTGNDSNDGLTWATAKATIANAIAALPANGGFVEVGYGDINVSSSARTDTSVSYSAGTWTDSSITSADVGSYVLGANMNNVIVPKILTVVNGVSFTTDTAPGGTVTSQAVVIVKPAYVHPAGVTIRGRGMLMSQSAGLGTGSPSATRVLDSGNGITGLIRGGTGSGGQAQPYGLENISFHGNANSTLYGYYVGNFAWYLVGRNVSFSFHGTAGMAFDGNINSDSFYDCLFDGNGTVGAAGKTGGVITHPYYLAPSASLNFYNPFFNANYGWGIVDGQATGACGVGLFQPQFNSTLASAATGSGTSAALTDHANGADAKSFIIGGWSESVATYDVDAYGSPTIINFTFGGSAVTNHLRVTGGTAQLLGCRFENSNNASIAFGSGGNIAWVGMSANDSFLYSGCGFSNANLPQMGFSGGAANGSGLQLGTGNAIFQGSGVPSNSIGQNGDFYFRTDGSVNTFIYQKTSGAWVLIVSTVPTQSAGDNTTNIATTAFVTTAVANAIAGVNPAVAVGYATTAAGDTSGLTYNNGVSGIGATLTGANNTVTTIDGHAFVAGDVAKTRLLVKNDTQSPSGAFNGVYLFTALHTAGTRDIFTRALDYDAPSDINNTGAIPVINGTANAQTTWVETANITTVGTDALSFTKFSLNPTTLMTTSTYDAAAIAQQVLGTTATQTVTNKRITKRVIALSAGSATPAINTDSYDVVHITAQNAAITSFTTNLTGTPVDGDTLRISITDNGTARALTWGASFEASTIALPTTTVISTRLDVGFFWNTETSKWRVAGVA